MTEFEFHDFPGSVGTLYLALCTLTIFMQQMQYSAPNCKNIFQKYFWWVTPLEPLLVLRTKIVSQSGPLPFKILAAYLM